MNAQPLSHTARLAELVLASEKLGNLFYVHNRLVSKSSLCPVLIFTHYFFDAVFPWSGPGWSCEARHQLCQGEAPPAATLGAGAGEGAVSFSMSTTACIPGLLREAGYFHSKVWIHIGLGFGFFLF